MSTSKQSQFEATLARISFGAVPIDGIYWLDPKMVARARAAGVTEPDSSSKRVEVRGETDGVTRTKRSPILLSLTRLLGRS
jgi:hypothetical protein